jgi:hypothetical protein
VSAIRRTKAAALPHQEAQSGTVLLQGDGQGEHTHSSSNSSSYRSNDRKGAFEQRLAAGKAYRFAFLSGDCVHGERAWLFCKCFTYAASVSPVLQATPDRCYYAENHRCVVQLLLLVLLQVG